MALRQSQQHAATGSHALVASDVALRAIDSVARIGDLPEVRALVLHVHVRLVRLGSLELLGRAIVAA